MSTSPPPRLRDGTDSLAEALRRLDAPPKLSPEVLARVGARIQTSAPVSPSRLPLSYGLLAGIAVVGLAVTGAWLAKPLEPLPPAADTVTVTVNPAVVHKTSLDVATSPVPPTAPVPLNAPLPFKAAEPKRRALQVRGEAPPEPVAPKAAQSTLAEETRLLRQALHQLNAEQNPTAALATLDSYDQRFPNGVFSREVSLTRIDALVAAGHGGTAVEKLGALKQSEHSESLRSFEREVLRAELLTEQGKHAEAIPLLEQLLTSVPQGALEERLLIARAKCAAMAGDVKGSQSGLARYLEKYPQGQFAAKVREQLEK